MYMVEGVATPIPPQHIYEVTREFKQGDEVMIRHMDGNHTVWSKGTVKGVSSYSNNEGSRTPVYHVETHNNVVKIERPEDIHPLKEATLGRWSPKDPVYDADKDKMSQVTSDRDKGRTELMKSLKKEFDAATKHYGMTSGEYADQQRQIGPYVEHYDDGHLKIKTGTAEGHRGDATFLPLNKDEHELKQVTFDDPLATPFSPSDLRRPKFHKDEISDAVGMHLKHHYSTLKGGSGSDKKKDKDAH